MTKNVKFIEDVPTLNQAIDAWGKQGKKWAEAGQVLAMSALKRLADHGDIGPINRLLLAMPKGTKVTAMKSWALAHGALVETADKLKAKDQPLSYTKDKQTDMAGGAADPWYNHKAETAQDSVVDLAKLVQAVIAKAKKPGAQIVNGHLLSQLESLTAESAEGNDGEPETGPT